MAGVHRLQHVESLTGATLANHDSVRSHTQTVLDQIANRHLSTTLDVGRAGLHAEHMVLMELEFLRILNRDDSLPVGNERRQHVESCCLTGSGTTRNDHVELSDHAGLQEARRVGIECAEADEIINLERIGLELSNGQKRATDRQRRDHRVHTRSVREASVAHRRRLVDATADLADDLVDDAAQMSLVDECDRVLGQPAVSFHVDRFRTVAHDFGHIVVAEQRVDRSVAENVIGDILNQLRFVSRRQRGPLLGQSRDQLLMNLLAKIVLRQPTVVQDRAKFIDEAVVNPLPQLIQHWVTAAGGCTPRLFGGGQQPASATAGTGLLRVATGSTALLDFM